MTICQVLDLSLDYLCLDKMPEVTVEPPEPNKMDWKQIVLGMCMGILMAVIAVCIAMAFQQEEPQANLESTPVVQQPVIDYNEILQHMEVSDAKIKSNGNQTYTVIFIPSLKVEGMQVRIVAYHNKTGLSGYLDAKEQGAAYAAVFHRPPNNFDVDFFAECTMGEITVKLPLIHFDGDAGSTTQWDLWK